MASNSTTEMPDVSEPLHVRYKQSPEIKPLLELDALLAKAIASGAIDEKFRFEYLKFLHQFIKDAEKGDKEYCDTLRAHPQETVKKLEDLGKRTFIDVGQEEQDAVTAGFKVRATANKARKADLEQFISKFRAAAKPSPLPAPIEEALSKSMKALEGRIKLYVHAHSLAIKDYANHLQQEGKVPLHEIAGMYTSGDFV